MQKPSRLIKLITPVILALLLALTGCANIVQLISPTPSPTPEPTPEPLIQVEGIPITFGQMSGNSYANTYFDVAVELDDLWFAEDTQNLDELNGLMGEVPQPEREQAYLDLLNDGVVVREFYAHSHTGLKSISVNIYDYSIQSYQPPDILMYYIDLTFGLTDKLKEAGYTVLDGLSSTVNIAGELQYCFYYSYEMDGTVWNCALVMMSRDKYIMNILFSSMVTNHVDEMIALFHKPVQ